jgi:hypothetical protein
MFRAKVLWGLCRKLVDCRKTAPGLGTSRQCRAGENFRGTLDRMDSGNKAGQIFAFFNEVAIIDQLGDNAARKGAARRRPSVSLRHRRPSRARRQRQDAGRACQRHAGDQGDHEPFAQGPRRPRFHRDPAARNRRPAPRTFSSPRPAAPSRAKRSALRPAPSVSSCASPTSTRSATCCRGLPRFARCSMRTAIRVSGEYGAAPPS